MMTYGQDYGQQNQYPQPGSGQQWPPQSWPSGQQSGPWLGQAYDPNAHQQRLDRPPAVYQNQVAPQGYGQPVVQSQPARLYGLTAAQKFWYILSNIAFGAGYFAKIPGKKAMADFGMTDLTGAEAFWYILMCIPFGAGYFAKLPVAKALSEMPQFRR